MGNLFSLAKRKEVAKLTFEQAIKTQKEEEELLKQQIEIANQTINEIATLQYAELMQDATRKLADIKETIRLAIEQREFIKALLMKASVLLCAIIYNYPFGNNGITQKSETIKQAWDVNAEEMLNVAVTEDVFMLLARIPVLTPALWPTGALDSDWHAYKSMDVSARNPESVNEYNMTVEAKKASYVARLREYIRNIFLFNVDSVVNIKDLNTQNTINAKCQVFIEKSKKFDQINNWLLYVIDFLKDQPYDLWKHYLQKQIKEFVQLKFT